MLPWAPCRRLRKSFATVAGGYRIFIGNQRYPVDCGGVFQQNPPLSFWEGFPSGQRDQTVNLTALPSVVRIHPPPPCWSRADVAGAGSFRWLSTSRARMRV